jgi:hypothetical protein
MYGGLCGMMSWLILKLIRRVWAGYGVVYAGDGIWFLMRDGGVIFKKD